MVMFATLRRSGGLEALSRHLKLSPVDGTAAAIDLLPEVLGLYRDIYDTAGGGAEGVAAVTRLIEPFGGSRIAFEILAPDPISADKAQGVLSGVLGDAGAIERLLATVRRDSVVPAERLATVLPMLVMLVGGYLTARVETAAESGEDIVAEFERLLRRGAGIVEPPRGED